MATSNTGGRHTERSSFPGLHSGYRRAIRPADRTRGSPLATGEDGLDVDGIAGPDTLATFALSSDAPATGARRPLPSRGSGSAATPEQIIRNIWPNDVEDEAVRIATRESRLVPTARNACCYGLFQIHFAAHRAWLGAYGVNNAGDLLTTRRRPARALALFQAAGWVPWRLWNARPHSIYSRA